ncbi:MAG TPA: isochorismatase family protein [Candidatus Acidoferrales bacterium]|nr:isochorismatase family protein [Candidatus Acidoferrales bacterium]
MNNPETNPGSPAPFGFRFIAPLALGAMLNPINSTMLSTALVPIADSLHVGIARTGWLIAVLYLTSAVAQPAMGRLADMLGPRRVYLVSLGLVAVAGGLGGAASSLTGLVLVRVLLGIGTSGAYPAAMKIFRVQANRIGCEPPRVAMGVLSLASLSSAAAGPLLGGVLTGVFGWRSIFTVNVGLALLTLILAVFWVPEDQPRRKSLVRLSEQVDFMGIAIFAAFLLSLMTFLMNLRPPIWLALLGAAAFGAALIAHSLRRRQPFIDVRMLALNRPLTVTYLRLGSIMVIVYSVLYGFAQWLEGSAGLTSAKAGLVTLPMSAVATVSSMMAVRTKGLRAPFLVSMGTGLIGCVCLFLMGSTTSIWLIAGAVAFFGVPMGMASTATQAAVYMQAPPEEIGTAAGLQRTAQYIGAISAASLLAFIYGHRATDHGLHALAVVMGIISAVLLVATFFDRTIPLMSSAAVPTTPESVTTQPKGKNMSLTKLDDTCALLVIDLQKGIVDLPTVHPASEIVDRSAQLARAFRKQGMPVVLVNLAGVAPGRTDAGSSRFSRPADWTDLVPELEPQPDDHIVTKLRWGAFAGTSLDGYLRERGVTQIVLTGIATSTGVESTARNAYDHGYNVTLVVDAMTDLHADAHRHSVGKIFPRLGESTTTEHLLRLLEASGFAKRPSPSM